MLTQIFETQLKHQTGLDKKESLLERLWLVRNGGDFTSDVPTTLAAVAGAIEISPPEGGAEPALGRIGLTPRNFYV